MNVHVCLFFFILPHTNSNIPYICSALCFSHFILCTLKIILYQCTKSFLVLLYTVIANLLKLNVQVASKLWYNKQGWNEWPVSGSYGFCLQNKSGICISCPSTATALGHAITLYCLMIAAASRSGSLFPPMIPLRLFSTQWPEGFYQPVTLVISLHHQSLPKAPHHVLNKIQSPWHGLQGHLSLGSCLSLCFHLPLLPPEGVLLHHHCPPHCSSNMPMWAHLTQPFPAPHPRLFYPLWPPVLLLFTSLTPLQTYWPPVHFPMHRAYCHHRAFPLAGPSAWSIFSRLATWLIPSPPSGVISASPLADNPIYNDNLPQHTHTQQTHIHKSLTILPLLCLIVLHNTYHLLTPYIVFIHFVYYWSPSNRM